MLHWASLSGTTRPSSHHPAQQQQQQQQHRQQQQQGRRSLLLQASQVPAPATCSNLAPRGWDTTRTVHLQAWPPLLLQPSLALLLLLLLLGPVLC
jgi:hypothetical protein